MAGQWVIGNMIAKLAADSGDFIKDMKGAEDAAKKFSKEMKGVESQSGKATASIGGIGSTLKNLVAGGLIAMAGREVYQFLSSSVVEAEAAAKAQAQLEAVIRSTGGAAGMTAGEVNA